MHFSGWTLLLQAINFVVLVWLLHRFLYKPILAVLDARKQEVAQLHATEQQVADQQAEVKKVEEGIGKSAEQARTEALEEAHHQIEAERKAALDAAAEEREAMLTQARARIEAERKAAVDELHDNATGLAIELSGRILQQLATDASTEALLDRAMSHLEGLPDDQRRELVDTLDGHPLVVRSWPELPEASRQHTRDRLHTLLGRSVGVDFQADEAVIGGVELHFPMTDVSVSIRSALEATREELDAG